MRSPLRGREETTGEVDPTTLRSRRRFARRQWARRWLAWRYVAAVILVLVLGFGSIWLVFFSSFLAVDGVDVEGTDSLSSAEVRAAAGVPLGEPLARVDLDAVRARVEAMALVRSAVVTRHWPDSVTIEIEERVAIATVTIAGQVRGMDAEGVLFEEYRQPPADLPQVRTSTETRSEALREGALVVAALPSEIAVRVDYVEVETVDRITLVLRDGRTVMWGSAEESEEKAEVLVALLRRPARSYDVSVPGQPTTSG